MKIMDKIWLLAAMFAFSACGSDETIVGQEEPEKELKEYTVSLKMGGEITTSESPLARAETESTDLYGVQVYRGSAKFAYGLFDNVNDMKINLLEGSTYNFNIVVVKNGKKGSDASYGTPFYHEYYRANAQSPASGTTKCTNSFVYDSSCSFVDIGHSDYPEGDWFFGALSEYVPTENGTVSIDLKHTVFGLKYEVKDVTDGTVSVTIKNNTRTFFTKSDITTDYTSEEKFIAFYDVYSAWQYADNYTENLTVSLSWTRGVGVVQNLGTKTIQVKRNVMNVVRIQLGSNDGNASFGITTEDDTSMTEESVDVPLK